MLTGLIPFILFRETEAFQSGLSRELTGMEKRPKLLDAISLLSAKVKSRLRIRTERNDQLNEGISPVRKRLFYPGCSLMNLNDRLPGAALSRVESGDGLVEC